MKPVLLIADGDAELCDLYRRFLTAGGYEVDISSDALDCLLKLRQRTPAALVLDSDLRWGGGDGILAWLREEGATHQFPVILTPTAGAPQDSAAFIEPPVVAYLPKPFSLNALLESVRSAVGQMGGRAPAKPNRVLAYSELYIG